MLNVILLAAGQGLRMGGPNKLLLPFRGQTVLETTLAQLCAANIGPVYVVTGHAREAVAPLLRSFPVQEVFHPDFHLGMTGSIQAGVRASQKAQGYMICLADMPLLTTAAYQLLGERFQDFVTQDEQAILVPRFGGARGNPVVFATAYRQAILEHPNPEGCRGIVATHVDHCNWVDMPDDGVLLDLDTPEDYNKVAVTKE